VVSAELNDKTNKSWNQGWPTVEAVAERTGVPNVDLLYRTMRLLATVGVFREFPGRRFSHTPSSALLRQDHPATLRQPAPSFSLSSSLPPSLPLMSSLMELHQIDGPVLVPVSLRVLVRSSSPDRNWRCASLHPTAIFFSSGLPDLVFLCQSWHSLTPTRARICGSTTTKRRTRKSLPTSRRCLMKSVVCPNAMRHSMSLLHAH